MIVGDSLKNSDAAKFLDLNYEALVKNDEAAAELSDRRKEIWREAKAAGINVKAMKEAYRRRRRTEKDPESAEQHDEDVEMYLSMLKDR